MFVCVYRLDVVLECPLEYYSGSNESIRQMQLLIFQNSFIRLNIWLIHPIHIIYNWEHFM